MSGYEEWTELFKEEVQSHLEQILQNDYDEHYYASYLKSLEENQLHEEDEEAEEENHIMNDAHKVEGHNILLINDKNEQSIIQPMVIVFLCVVIVWLAVQFKKKWKAAPISLENTKELPVTFFILNPHCNIFSSDLKAIHDLSVFGSTL